jgi:hypothetical protein
MCSSNVPAGALGAGGLGGDAGGIKSRSTASIRSVCVALTVGLGVTFAAAAAESGTDASPTITFDIPAQPLVTALQAYGEASGVHVIYESGIEVGLKSSVVVGKFTREQALKALLGNSDLVVRFARADSVVLLNPAAVQRDEPPEIARGTVDMALDTVHVEGARPEPDRNALTEYVGAIQQDVGQALRKRDGTSSGNYRVGVELWVDPSRTIRKTEVFRSTGDRERDVAISQALQGVVIRQPAPAHTPQPVRVMIMVNSE